MSYIIAEAQEDVEAVCFISVTHISVTKVTDPKHHPLLPQGKGVFFKGKPHMFNNM